MPLGPVHGETVLDPACGTGGFLTAVIEHLKASASSVAEREAIAHNVRGWEYKPLPYMLANTNLILHDIINARYVNNRPTVLISNLFGQELEDYLGLRISDRIQQATVDMLKFDEESKRPSCRDDYLKGLEEI